MSALLLRNVFLSLHVFSIVILSGSLVGGVVAYRLIWQAFDSAPEQLPFVARANRLFGLCGALGGGLLLLTGVGLLGATHWVYWGTPWLTIKLMLFVGLALIGNLVSKPQGKALEALISGHLDPKGQGGAASAAVDPRWAVLRQRMALVHGVHVVMFVAVVMLAVFKP